MPLPTGSFGQSWRLDAYAVESGSAPVYLPLPTTHSVWYKAPLGLYYGCAGDDVLAVISSLGFSASLNSISVLQSGDGHEIYLYQSTTAFAGLVDTVIRVAPPVSGGIGTEFALGVIEIWYAFTSGSTTRSGLIVGDVANPHLSLYPYNWDRGTRFAGDIYMSTGSRDASGLKIVDYNADKSLYTGSFVTAILSGSISRVSQSSFSGSYPLRRFLGASGFVSNEPFTTVVSGGIGHLIENATWDAGFLMTDSGTITITGVNSFIVPTGSVYLTSSLNLNENRIYIRGNESTFEMNAISASAYINSQRWVHLTSSAASVVDEGTDTPPMDEGTILYVIPAAGMEINEAHVRAAGQWWALPSGSTFTILDGGTY